MPTCRRILERVASLCEFACGRVALLALITCSAAFAQVTITSTSPVPTVQAGVPYTYAFTASGGTTPYHWSFTGTLPGGLNLSNAGVLSGTAPNDAAADISVTVTDSSASAQTNTQDFLVFVNPTITTTSLNNASARQDFVPQTLTQTGASAPSWSASGLPGGMNLSSSGVLTGEPLDPGLYSVQIFLEDGSSETGTNVTLPLIVGPYITDPSPLPGGVSGTSYSYTFGSAFPVTAGTPPFTWTNTQQLPPGLSLSSAGVLSGIPTTTGLYSFTIQITDSTTAAYSTTFGMTIASQPVTVTTIHAPPPSDVNLSYPPSGATAQPYFSASGGAGSYSWSATGLPPGISINSGTAALSGTPTGTGSFLATVTATDSLAQSGSTQFTLVINAPPSITTTSPLAACTAATNCSRPIAATAGTGAYTWSLSTGTAPPGMSLTTAGVLTGPPNPVASPTTSTFSARVTDSVGGIAVQSFQVPVNPAIAFTPASLPATSSGAHYSQSFNSTGGTGAITYTGTNLPGWLSVTSAGVLSGTAPLESVATPFSFSINATDTNNATTSNPYTVTVNPAPTISQTSPLGSWTINRPYSSTFTATGGSGSGYTFAITGGAQPTGLTLASGGGLAGTPTAAGTFNFTVTVTDSFGGNSSKAFQLTLNAAPSVTTTTLPATTSTASYSQTLTESGGTPAFTWSGTGLPSWLSLSAAGALTGTAPAVASATPFSFGAFVTDSAGAVSATQQLSVTVNPAPQITTASPLPQTGSNAFYSQTFASSGGTGTITWSTQGLPSWLTPSGAQIFGIAPSVSAATVYNVTVGAVDSLGVSTSKAFAVTVNPAPTITTSSPISPWTIGRSYSSTFAATGGVASYSFASDGNQPSGLTIATSGLMSGIPNTVGTYNFTVFVTDSVGGNSSKAFSMTINPAPTVTTASLPGSAPNAAYSQTLAESGGTAPFTWSAINLPGWLNLSTAGLLTGTAPNVGVATTYNFNVIVTDTAGAASPAKALSVTVSPGVQITTTSPLPSTDSGLSYSQTFAASGGTGTYTWTSSGLPGWLLLSTAGALTGTAPTVAAATPFTFNITATDSASASQTGSFTVTVNPVPAITTVSPLAPWTINRPYSSTISAHLGVPPYSFTIVSGAQPTGLSLASNGALTGTPTAAGTFSFTVRVTDSVGGNTSSPLQLTINPAPAVTTTSLPGSTPNASYNQTLAETGGTPSFTWSGAGLPSWLSLSPAGVLTGTAPGVSTPTTYTFTVSVTDSTGAVSAPQQLSIIVTTSLQITTTSPLAAWTVNRPYSSTFAAAGGSTPYTFAITGGTQPTGLSLASSGAFTGTPTATGTFTFTVRVTDNAASTSSSTFQMTINPAPAVTTTSLPGSTPGANYNQTLAETGGTPAFTWSATGLPSWLSLSPAGVLTGTAPNVSTPTTYTFTVSVTDSTGAVSAPQSLSVIVSGALQITTTSPLAAWTVNRPYSSTFAAAGGSTPYTFAITGGTQPTGLSLASSGAFTGTATATGTFTFTVRVTDNAASTSSSTFQMTINGPPVVSTTSLPGGTPGASYSQTLAETGGTSPFTWSGTGLPSWLSLSPAGVLTGTAPNIATPTTYNFSVTVTDFAGAASAAQPLSITVGGSLQITTTSPLAPWTVNRPYTSTFAASGGSLPYTFAITGGTQPTGLSLSTAGALTGIPTAAGTYNFTVTVTDNLQSIASASFQLIINGPPVVSTTSLPGAQPAAAYSQTLANTGGTAPFTWSGVNLPNWLSLSTAGVLTGTAPAVQSATTYTFSVVVTDSAGAASAARSLSVTVTPVITVVPLSFVTGSNLGQWTAGRPYSVTLAATGGTTPYTFTDNGATLPSFFTISPNGVLSGVPGAAGTFTFTIRVTDAASVNATRQFTLIVNAAPVVNPATLPPTTSGLHYSQTLTATGGTGSVSWNSAGLPSWLSLSGPDLSGVAPIVASQTAYGFSVTVSDATGSVSGPQAFSVIVNPPVLITTSSPLPQATPGQPYSASFAATGGTGGVTWTTSSLPSWLTQNGSNVSGVVPASAAGTTTGFTVIATDSLGESNQKSFSLTIGPRSPIVSSTLPDWTVNRPYSASLSASSGTPPYVSWAITSGSLPAGLSLNTQTGAVTGTPTAVAKASFTAQVTDSAGVIGSGVVSFQINAAPQIPAQTLPTAGIGAAYSQSIGETGGTGPLIWSATGLAGSGLSLNSHGVLSGVPTTQTPTTIPFTATVTDAAGATAQAALSVNVGPAVTITNPGLPPTTSTASYSAGLGASGGVGNYNFTAAGLPSWLSLNPSGQLTGIAPIVTAPTPYSFTATATDSTGVAGSRAFSVLVNPRPAVSTTALPSGTIGAIYSASLAATGGTGSLHWSATNLPAWLSLNAATGALSGTPPAVASSTFSVTVTDSVGVASQPASLSLQIHSTGGQPAGGAQCPFPPTTATLPFNQTVTANGGFPPFAWTSSNLPAWLSLSPAGTLTGAAVAGSYSFTLAATDAQRQQIPVACGILVNPAPLVVTTSLAPGVIGAPYYQGLTAIYGTGALSWSATGLPPGLSLDPATGQLSGTPAAPSSGPITVQVTDSLGALSAPAAIPFSIAPSGGRPIITACPLPSAAPGNVVSFPLTAALGTPPYIWNVTGLPGGLNASAPGIVSGQATLAGTSTVSLSLTDSAGLTASASCPMTITPLVVATSSLPDGGVGVPYFQPLNASGGVGPLSWSPVNLPSWLSLDATSGVLSGTPSNTGSYPVTVAVRDSAGNHSPPATLGLNVVSGGLLAITTGCPLRDVTQGTLVATPFTAHGGAPPYQWTATGLPSSLTLTPPGILIGLPATGRVSFSVTVTDQQEQSTSEDCSFNVNPRLAITTTALPSATAGVTYTASLAAAGGTGHFAWSGGLPAWLSVNSATGVITGIPPAVGSTSVSAQVRDGAGASDAKTFSLQVNALPPGGTAPNPALTTSCPLAPGAAGQSYLQNLTASGGRPPYLFSVLGLPAGLSADASGSISGQPLTAASVSLIIEVADASGQLATASCGLAIAAAPRLSLTANTPDGKVGTPYSGECFRKRRSFALPLLGFRNVTARLKRRRCGRNLWFANRGRNVRFYGDGDGRREDFHVGIGVHHDRAGLNHHDHISAGRHGGGGLQSTTRSNGKYGRGHLVARFRFVAPGYIS